MFLQLDSNLAGTKYFSPDVLICTCVCACVIYIYASPTPVFNLAPLRRLISVAKALGLIGNKDEGAGRFQRRLSQKYEDFIEKLFFLS